MKTLLNKGTVKRLTALLLALILVFGTAGIPGLLTQPALADEEQTIYRYVVNFVGFTEKPAIYDYTVVEDLIKTTDITASAGVEWSYRTDEKVHVATISSKRNSLILQVGDSGNLGAYANDKRLVPLCEEYPVAYVEKGESFVMYLKPETSPDRKIGFIFASAASRSLNIAIWTDEFKQNDDIRYYDGTNDAAIPASLKPDGPAFFRIGYFGTGIKEGESTNGDAIKFAEGAKLYFAIKFDITADDSGDWQWRLCENGNAAKKLGIFEFANWPPAANSCTIETETKTFILHYYKYPPEVYDGWDAWIWEDPSGSGKGYAFDSYDRDADGWITLTAGLPAEWEKIGLIVRKSDWTSKSNSTDIVIGLPTDRTEVWHLHGENVVYPTKGEADTSAKPIAALADADKQILITMNFPQEQLDIGHFSLYDVIANTAIDVENAWLGGGAVLTKQGQATLVTTASLQPNKLYQVRYNTTGVASQYKSCDVTMRDILNSYATTATDLGLSYTALNSVFKIWAPTAISVQVALYNSLNYSTDYDSDGKIKASKLENADDTLEMARDASTGVWTSTEPATGDLKGSYYIYKITLPSALAVAPVNYAVDPYAKAVSANGQLGAIIDPAATGTVEPLDKAAADARNIRLYNDTDHIIYEMHIRDFTIDPSSGVNSSIAGKYEGAYAPNTRVPGYPNVTTGIDHLVELGVTTVHLLPIFDGASVNELGSLVYGQEGAMNWGYDPQNYNVPEGSYSSDPKDPYARITELKALISALHKKGIRVVMDVVYNHTFSISDGPFEKVVPGYYYRTWDNGSFSNGSGCGNETASERAMVGKFILDSLLYWQKEYGMDGFRFDLMALHDIDTMCKISQTLKKVDPDCVIYGEPWVASETPLPFDKRTTNGKQYGNGFAIFNDDVREAIRGDHSTYTDTDPAKLGGFAGGASERNGAKIEDLILRSVYANYGHLSRASESITYTGKHDNLVLWDMMQRAQGTKIYSYHGANEKPSGEDSAYAKAPYAGLNASLTSPLSLANMDSSSSANAARSSLLAVGLVLTIQGVPFLHSGDEFLRTKYGNGNSYNANDKINAVNWENKVQFKEVYEYQQGLIQLRNRHPAFRMDSKSTIEGKITDLLYGQNTPQLVAYKMGEFAGGDDWKNIYVAYNGSGFNKSVTFGNSVPLNIVVNSTKAGIVNLGTIAPGASYTLPPYSMVVAYDEEGGYGQPVLTSISISPTTSNFNEGESLSLTLAYLDQEGNEFFGARPGAVWSSSNDSIARVDQNGSVTGVKEGTAVITAKVGSLPPATASVTVNKPRFLVIMYTGATAEVADVWSWDDEHGGMATPFTAWVKSEELWAAVIPVSWSVDKVGYIIRKVAADEWANGNKDVNDNQSVTLNETGQLTVVKVTAGVEGQDNISGITYVSIPDKHVKVTNFDGMFDGAPHSITVTVTGGGAVTYSTSPSGLFRIANPSFVEAGTHTVYFWVDRGSPWEVYQGTGTVKITKATLGGTVAIRGAARFGELLTADTVNLTTDIPDANKGALSYQWKRGGTNIGTNSATYTPVLEDIGQTLTVTVTAAFCDGNVTSAATAAVAKAVGPALPVALGGAYTGDGSTFTYTVTKITGAEYSKDKTSWSDSNAFTGFVLDDTATFYARIKETPTHNAGAIGEIGPVTFVRLKGPPVPAIDFTLSDDGFPKTITITPIDGAEYQFNGGGWGSENKYISTNEDGEDVEMSVRIKQTGTHEESLPATKTINTSNNSQEPPKVPLPLALGLGSMDFVTFIVTIPWVEGAEYSFDGQIWSATENEKKGCLPGDTVTGYIRTAAKPGYNVSGTLSVTMTLPRFQAAMPEASPNGGTFTQSVTVTLSCLTPDATIYYTLDGSDPSADGVPYSEPFTLTETTTVRAIAGKADMDDSAEMKVQFTKSAPKHPPEASAGSDTATIPGDGGEVTVDVPVKIDKDTGEVLLKLDADIMETLIADAQEHGRGITFDLSGVAEAKAAVLDVDTAKMISEAGDSLTIKFPGSEVNFDTDALTLLAHASDLGSTPITVKAEIVPMEELEGMQAAQTFGYDTVISIEVFVGDAKLDVPLTISLPYELKAGEDPAAVCAWYMNDDGDLTRLSGVYDAEAGVITFTVGHQSCFVVGYDPVVLWKNIFSDISGNAWYYDAVAYANYYSLFNGDDLGNFLPTGAMSRAMFATVLWNMEGRPAPEGTKGFTDVPKGVWFYDAVLWAAESGIVSGSGNEKFEPQRAIARQEMVVLLHSYASFKDYNIPKNRELPQFSDHGQIGSWAKDAANAMADAGVINGNNGKFNPTDSATRAEVATLFKNFMRFIVMPNIA